MDAPKMLAHLTEAMRMATGELKVPSKNIFALQHFPLKHLILYVLPFPRGAPTAPALIARTATDWDAEVATLVDTCERFATRDPNSEQPVHPAFGSLSHSAWGVLAYRHCDHHLRQFGA